MRCGFFEGGWGCETFPPKIFCTVQLYPLEQFLKKMDSLVERLCNQSANRIKFLLLLNICISEDRPQCGHVIEQQNGINTRLKIRIPACAPNTISVVEMSLVKQVLLPG